MFISQINNSNNNTNFRALYFGQPRFPNTFCLSSKNLKCSSKGIEYSKDNVSNIIKKRFMQVPFIKNLSKTDDVFVLYGGKASRITSSAIISVITAFITWGKSSKENAQEIAFWSEESDESQAIETLFKDLNAFSLDKSKLYNHETIDCGLAKKKKN